MIIDSMKNKFLYLSGLLILAGCAVPPDVDKQAQMYLVGDCYKMFTSSAPAGYQHSERLGRVAFALASDGPGLPQACGAASDRWNDLPSGFIFSNTPMDQLEAVAIARCDQFRAQMGNIRSPCRTFARNNDIVWGRAMSKGMQ